MANTVQFVSTDYIRQNTVIENNVDDNKIVPFIFKVQATYLQQALGTSFFDHLQTAFIGSSLTAAETALIREYIQPMVVEYTLYEVLPFLNYKATNKAISTENSEFSTPSGLDEIKYLRNSVRDMAEFYLKRLNKYLCDNLTLFPVYAASTGTDNLAKSSKSYFSGIYIPNRNKIDRMDSYSDPTNCDC